MRVLILSSSAGNGHNSTANRLKNKILENDTNAVVEIVDAYKSFSSPLKAWIMEKGYFFACNHFVSIYNYFFKKSENSKPEDRDKSKANKDTYCLLYGMLKKIYDFKPDVIISTYIFCSVALTNLKRYYEIPAVTMCMTLDYGISPYWQCCCRGLDYMFLTGEYMVEPFKKLGYNENQLIVSGIPIADNFFVQKEKNQSRSTLNLEENLFTVLVMKASFFPVNVNDLFKQFAKIKNKIQIVIVNGKDTKSKTKIDKLIKKHNLIHNIVNIGFTNQIVDYINSADIVLGKAGGLSTTEQISLGVPGLIVDKLPAQEIYNKDYLIKNKAALGVTKNNIAKNIQLLIDDKNLYNNLKTNALNIRKSYPLDAIYSVIKNVKNADYSDIHFTDKKRDVIKNIDKKRKNTVKTQKNYKKGEKYGNI